LGAGNTAGAVTAFERVVALAPDDPLAHFNLGVALRRSGALARARAAFQRALRAGRRRRMSAEPLPVPVPGPVPGPLPGRRAGLAVALALVVAVLAVY